MTIKKFLHNESWIIVFSALALGFVWPTSGLWLTPYVAYLLMILIMISVLDVKYREVIKHIHKFKIIIYAILIIHVLSPLFILILKPWLDPNLFLGLILASAIPSGLSVIFFTKLFSGHTSEALVITILSNLLAPITVPMIVYLFAREDINISLVDLSLTIIKLVIIPLIIARIIRPTRLAKIIKKISTPLSLILLFLIILGIIAPLHATLLANLKTSIFIGLIVTVLIIASTVIGFLLGKNKEEKRTLMISVSYKNYTLAIVTAMALFDPIVGLPAIMYAVMNNVILLLMQLFFKVKHNTD